MSRQKTRDTQPEVELRRQLYAMGIRYRLHRRPVSTMRRTADIVFTKAKIAVVVHGCFWHSCPTHGTFPFTNAEWWKAKLDRNVERDAETQSQWELVGWDVVVVWEHENPSDAARRIKDLLERKCGICL